MPWRCSNEPLRCLRSRLAGPSTFGQPEGEGGQVDACGDFRAEAVGGERGELDEVECEVWEEGSE